MKKVCIKCGESKELDMFSKGSKYKDGRRNTCKKCHSFYVTTYYKSNPNKRQLKNKTDFNWKRHGLTKEQYDKLMKKHDGKCHSCKDRLAINIDHDHSCCSSQRSSCGKCIRGILCSQCNTALGLLNDEPKKIKSLLKYIGL